MKTLPKIARQTLGGRYPATPIVGSEVDALVHEHKSRYPSRKGKCPTLFSPSIIKMVSDANNNLILVVQLQSDFFRY